MLKIENQLKAEGYQLIAGADEVGRGALAGPIVAASVILPQPVKFSNNIRDSKLMTAKQREKAVVEIKNQVLAWAISHIENHEIDKMGLQKANLTVLYRAVKFLKLKPDFVLFDGYKVDIPGIKSSKLIKGDQQSLTIAAASIIAKVHRDDLMIKYHRLFPNYGFDKNKGYGSAFHLSAIKTFGPSPIHRMSFSPLANLNQDSLLTISKNSEVPRGL